ncbi:MAG TPA: type II toxin-antitoxin system VapC family toxin [Gemmataceae bacterium]|nr:type II toxin-antitoxin system VapC family toxin [Gemmataceae bacterium]
MRRYILDPNALSDFINHRNGLDVHVRTVRARGDRVGTCVPVIGELLYGVELSATRDENLKRVRAGLTRVTIWPYTREAGEEFGRLRAALRRIGRPMQIVDVMLAAIALSLGNCTVVTTDSDLTAVPGLSVENWATP